MSRRTVDITVDAYDAPSLIAVARERERQRELGHDDAMEMPIVRVLREIPSMRLARPSIGYMGIACASVFRTANDQGRVSCATVMLEEVAEAVEELMELELMGDAERRRKSEAAEVELTQGAAVMLRIASKLRAARLRGE
jgi:hypothetical protein